MSSEEPIWQPLGRLPLVAAVVDAGLAGAREQLEVLLGARRRRSTVDERILATVTAVFTRFRNDTDFYDEQLHRWGREKLSLKQRREVDRLADQVYRFRQVIEDVLGVARELAGEGSSIGNRSGR